MKPLTILLALGFLTAISFAQGSSRVRTYVKRDGTIVQSHRRTNPDRSFNNNWSTKPNTNPYTGATGTKTTRPRKR